jgi:hypothetical protein
VKIYLGDCVVEALVDTGASKCLISDKILVQLKISGIPYSFSRDVSINLFDINDRRLSCIGTIKTNIRVENENTPEFLSQEFVVAQGIMEDCILGLDALYEHKFVIDGFENRIYRVREPDQFNNRLETFIMNGGKLTIPPFSACVMESGGYGTQLPPDTSFIFKGSPGLPMGLRIDPFISQGQEFAFRLVLVNESNKTIKLASTTSLGRILFVRNETAKIASLSTKITIPHNFKECLKDIPEEHREKLHAVVVSYHTSPLQAASTVTSLSRHQISPQ